MIHPNADLEEIQRLGTVSKPQDRPPVDPFSGSQEPYLPDPADFEDEEKEKRQDSIARAVIKVDWKQILGEK